jgi:biotin transport system substrate-specific component
MGAALISVLSLLPGLKLTPTVPFTFQVLAVCLVAFLFDGRTAGLATGLYVLLGALGLPIFSGGKSGAAVLAGPTGGYLIGFILAGFIAGWLSHRSHSAIRAGQATRAVVSMLLAGLVGLVVIHAAGVVGLMFAVNLPLGKAIAVTAAFIPLDIVKMIIAAVIAVAVLRAFRSQLLTVPARA